MQDFSMRRALLAVLLPLALAGCDVFGSKDDATTDDIFGQGKIDPSAVADVGYVPVQPFFREGFDGAFDRPVDVYVGYDEFVYVADARGVHVLDRAGRPLALVAQANGQPLVGIERVIQDRRFHLYVAARRDTVVEGRTRRLPVVYRFSGVTTGTPRVEDVIWHPFDDINRQLVLRNPIDADERVRLTDVAILPGNSVYVTRTGPLDVGLAAPYNTVMEFSPAGVNTRNLAQLSGRRPSLVSSVNPAAIVTRVQPPQRTSFPAGLDFFVAQSPYPSLESPASGRAPLAYGVLSIRVTETPDGLVYGADASKLAAATTGPALYSAFRFDNPTGLAYAADGTNYLFVVDSGKDSLFVFNANGVEGVAAPPGARDPRPVRVSFGGEGDAPLRLRDPHGVAYFGRTVYVADTGNNRITRYRLNTDLE